MSAGPDLYDLLDVDRGASDAEIRAAWKAEIADLDPTDRRFRMSTRPPRCCSTRSSGRRTTPSWRPPSPRPSRSPRPEPEPEPVADGRCRIPNRWRPPTGGGRWVVPTWLLIGVGVLTVLVIAAAAYFWTQPSDSSIEESTREAQSAAERAIVPVLSYDYKTLDDDQAAAQAAMTSDYRKEYDRSSRWSRRTRPSTGTAITTEVIASGIVRSGEDRVEVLLFVNQPTTNKQQKDPVVFKNQVRVTMQLVGDEWLIDDMQTSPVAK